MTARALGPPGQRTGPVTHPAPSDEIATATAKRLIAGLGASVADLDDLRPGPLAAWRDACLHLASRGLPPLPPEHVRRALVRRGWWCR